MASTPINHTDLRFVPAGSKTYHAKQLYKAWCDAWQAQKGNTIHDDAWESLPLDMQALWYDVMKRFL